MADLGSTARSALSMGGPKTSAGKSLIASAPASQQGEGFGGIEKAGNGKETGLLRSTHNRGVGVRRDDQLAAGRGHFLNLRRRGQSAGSNQHPVAEGFATKWRCSRAGWVS